MSTNIMRIRFYGNLNDFIGTSERGKAIAIRLSVNQPIKDVIEGKGVPHTEVALIIANGLPVKFDYISKDGDYVSVYPPFFHLDPGPENNLQIPTPRPVRFVADAHLGRLARYLRMLGFDCIYRPDIGDHEVIDISLKEERVVLTRDVGILKENRTRHGYFIRSQFPRKQLVEVVLRYNLTEDQSPFIRCMMCNGLLVAVEKNEVLHQLPEKVKVYFNEYYQCNQCGKIYWEGSHHEDMKRFIRALNQGL
jgi:uncharacterized protein